METSRLSPSGGFLRIIECSLFHGCDRKRNIAICGDDDDRHRVAPLIQRRQSPMPPISGMCISAATQPHSSCWIVSRICERIDACEQRNPLSPKAGVMHQVSPRHSQRCQLQSRSSYHILLRSVSIYMELSLIGHEKDWTCNTYLYQNAQILTMHKENNVDSWRLIFMYKIMQFITRRPASFSRVPPSLLLAFSPSLWLCRLQLFSR